MQRQFIWEDIVYMEIYLVVYAWLWIKSIPFFLQKVTSPKQEPQCHFELHDWSKSYTSQKFKISESKVTHNVPFAGNDKNDETLKRKKIKIKKLKKERNN